MESETLNEMEPLFANRTEKNKGFIAVYYYLQMGGGGVKIKRNIICSEGKVQNNTEKSVVGWFNHE